MSGIASEFPRNVEIKARIRNVSATYELVRQLSGTYGTILHQEDIFYKSAVGRLKHRSITQNGQKRVELIYYERPDISGPKCSRYHKVDWSEISGEFISLRRLLEACLGIRGSVIKTRTLHLIGQTRIHLDVVQNLGHFLELEVVLTPDQSVEHGQKIAEDLIAELKIQEEDLLEDSYMDLLEKHTAVQ